MLSAPFSDPRAMSGIETSASGSAGVPGMNATRESRCAWFASTGSRLTTAQPVMPCPNAGRVRMISFSHSDLASTGISSRRVLSAS